MAKFHAISFCMKEGNCENLFERFPTLREDRYYKDSKKSSFGRILCSLYRSDTYEFTNRTFTPILASLAELIRFFPPGRANQFPNYYPFMYQLFFRCYFVLLCRYLTIRLTVCRCTPQYADNYEWFVELAKNFHSVQTQMVSILFIFTISLSHAFLIHLLKMGDSNSLV